MVVIDGTDQMKVLFSAPGFPGVDALKNIIDSVAGSSTGGTPTPSNGNFFSALPDQGDGWRESSWFGWINPFNDNWAFHLEHGWLYLDSNASDGSMFYYDLRLGWIWTGSGNYPSLYAFDQPGGWIFFEKGTGNQFFNFQSEQTFFAQ